MIAWALGRIGGEAAETALSGFPRHASGHLKKEIERALAMAGGNIAKASVRVAELSGNPRSDTG